MWSNDYVFHCQLAHGSPLTLLFDFSNIDQLYRKIAQEYEIPYKDVLFCTLNTHKIDLDDLLRNSHELRTPQGLIFAHVSGRRKTVTFTKTGHVLGIAVIWNGVDYVMVKEIDDESILKNEPMIQVGDVIERMNGEVITHGDVMADVFRSISIGEKVEMELIEPRKWSLNALNGTAVLKPDTSDGNIINPLLEEEEDTLSLEDPVKDI